MVNKFECEEPMKKIIITIIVIGLLLNTMSIGMSSEEVIKDVSSNSGGSITHLDELIIKFRDDVKINISASQDGVIATGIESIDVLNMEFGVTSVECLLKKYEDQTFFNIYLFKMKGDVDIFHTLDEYNNDSSVEFAGLNYFYDNVDYVQFEDTSQSSNGQTGSESINANPFSELISGILIEDTSESYIIEGVPYIGTETGFDCEMASFAMLYQYLGMNYSYHDLFYLCGASYSLGSRPKWTGFNKYGANLYKSWPWIPPIRPYIDPGCLVSLWEKDFEFLSDLFGVDCNISYMNEMPIDDEGQVDEDAAWNIYWSRVKNYIKRDMPVWTTIDGCCIPWWREHLPQAQKYYDKGIPGPIAHIIVLVGFNESNGTVCYNDMCNANISKYGYEYVGEEDEICKYIWMNLSSLKEGTGKGSPYYWPKYCITMVLEENESKPQSSKSEAFELTHERNIEKMQGYSEEVYDKEYLDFYRKFGLDALKALDKDLELWRMKPTIRWWRFLQKWIFQGWDPFDDMLESLFYIIKDKQFASESLLNYADLHDFCEYDGLLLQNESQKWEELRNLYLMFEEMYKNNKSVKSMIPVIKEMNIVIDEIIVLQEKILEGPDDDNNLNLPSSVSQSISTQFQNIKNDSQQNSQTQGQSNPQSNPSNN